MHLLGIVETGRCNALLKQLNRTAVACFHVLLLASMMLVIYSFTAFFNINSINTCCELSFSKFFIFTTFIDGSTEVGVDRGSCVLCQIFR